MLYVVSRVRHMIGLFVLFRSLLVIIRSFGHLEMVIQTMIVIPCPLSRNRLLPIMLLFYSSDSINIIFQISFWQNECPTETCPAGDGSCASVFPLTETESQRTVVELLESDEGSLLGFIALAVVLLLLVCCSWLIFFLCCTVSEGLMCFIFEKLCRLDWLLYFDGT